MGMIVNPFRFASVSDPNWSSVKLLMGFEGSDGATGSPGMNDESSAAHGTGTANGNAQIDTAQFKFGGSSLLLDGTGDWVHFADSEDWNLASVNFTIESFVRFNSVTPFSTIVGQWSTTSSQRGWILDFPGSASNVLRFIWSGNGIGSASLQPAWTPTTGVWYHVCAERSGDTLRVYADGVMLGSAALTGLIHNSTATLQIGSIFSGSQTNFLNGWLDELRITKGAARYASDSGFTVPAAAYPRS